MLLQVTKALTAMAAEAMVVVRATVEITVAAAVEAKEVTTLAVARAVLSVCLLYTSPSPRDQRGSRMPSSA